MLRESTREEVEAREKIVREYRVFSRDPRKKLIGILMDLHVGGFGMLEEIAELKADEILREFTALTL